uniref:Putative slow border cells n=1 Tax=Corethrella appendiculata TaxID=1370023 RepID=U5EHW6_9DIPT
MAANSSTNNTSQIGGGNSNNNNGNNNNNNNSPTAVNQNTLALKQQQQQQLHQQHAQSNNTNSNTANNNNNSSTANANLLSKQMLQQIHYTQSELEELTSQEISLDLQHLIDDQFRDPESLGIFTEMVTVGSTNGSSNNSLVQTAAAKALQLQQARLQHTNNTTNGNPNSYQRSQLAYMPQPVHTGSTYTNNSSDENSSIGSDTTNIKEEPIDPNEYRRQLVANGAQFIASANTNSNNNPQQQHHPYLSGNGSNYITNGNGNTFTNNLTPATVLQHQTLPHIAGAHLANLKHKQILPHISRKQQQKNVDKGTEEYRRRRERNNIAVRKSREKAKVRSREVEEKVKTLLKEKDALIRKIEEKNNEIQLYKQLYMHLINHSNPEINQICRSALNLSNMGDHM